MSHEATFPMCGIEFYIHKIHYRNFDLERFTAILYSIYFNFSFLVLQPGYIF